MWSLLQGELMTVGCISVRANGWFYDESMLGVSGRCRWAWIDDSPVRDGGVRSG